MRIIYKHNQILLFSDASLARGEIAEDISLIGVDSLRNRSSSNSAGVPSLLQRTDL